MTEHRQSSRDTDAYELLLRAVRAVLTPEEQDRVLHAVLVDRPSWSAVEAPIAFAPMQHVIKVPGSEEVGFLVRLPAPLHREFRAWCKGHGFSMAVVIRGIVERFLAQQGVRE